MPRERERLKNTNFFFENKIQKNWYTYIYGATTIFRCYCNNILLSILIDKPMSCVFIF